MIGVRRWANSLVIAVISALLFTLLFGTYRSWLELLYVVAITAIFTTVINYLMVKHDERLTNRVEADQPAMWKVLINDVEVGTVSDSQYAVMERRAFRDGRLVLSQFFNLGRMAMKIATLLLVAVPLLFFWAALALAIFSPESYMKIMQELQEADPTAIKLAARTLLEVALSAMFIALGIVLGAGYRFGFRDHYSEAVSRMLRQHCNTPAEGDVYLKAQKVP